MKWKLPPPVKVYEALSAVADGRVEARGTEARVRSSSGEKAYDVTYDPIAGEIMANDNGSYWQGYLGYPAIAFLMQVKALPYDEQIASRLRNVPWKKINAEFKRDYAKAIAHILSSASEAERKETESFVRLALDELRRLDLGVLGKRVRPPKE